MTVYDLNRDQLIELKQQYLQETQGSLSYADMADADYLVSDSKVMAYYDGYEFSNDDFASTAGEDEEEYFSLDLGDCRGTRSDIAQDLRQIANDIENENFSGIAYYGTSWGLDRN